MATTQQREQREQHERLEQHKRETLNSLIGEQVIHILGEPGHLYKVQVRQLWDDHYRVNVLVGLDAASVKVAHSYFLAVDGDGKIIGSSPTIARQY